MCSRAQRSWAAAPPAARPAGSRAAAAIAPGTCQWPPRSAAGRRRSRAGSVTAATQPTVAAASGLPAQRTTSRSRLRSRLLQKTCSRSASTAQQQTAQAKHLPQPHCCARCQPHLLGRLQKLQEQALSAAIQAQPARLTRCSLQVQQTRELMGSSMSGSCRTRGLLRGSQHQAALLLVWLLRCCVPPGQLLLKCRTTDLISASSWHHSKQPSPGACSDKQANLLLLLLARLQPGPTLPCLGLVSSGRFLRRQTARRSSSSSMVRVNLAHPMLRCSLRCWLCCTTS